MRQPRIFKRGNVYRVASPGWFFWHWSKNYGANGIWASNSYESAKIQLRLEKDRKWYNYDIWQEVIE